VVTGHQFRPNYMSETIKDRIDDHVETEVWFAIMWHVTDQVRSIVQEHTTSVSASKEQDLFALREEQLEEESE